MCGYFTIVNKSKTKIKGETIVNMLNSILHRGPDSGAISIHKNKHSTFLNQRDIDNEVDYEFNYLLCHRRLSIHDTSNRGIQPMSSKDNNIHIAYNGEIYNYIEIKEELIKKGHIFQNKTDTEVILNAYKEWGTSCVNKFNGMWSFTILDENKNTLIISRDRMGIKPLYKYEDDDFIIYSSELKVFNFIKKLRYKIEYIYTYILDGVDLSRRNTEFENVTIFPRATISELKDGKEHPTEFWKLNYDTEKVINEKYSKENEEKYSKELYRLLKDSVRLRLRSDVGIGSALSGGLDSSAIVFLVNEILMESGNVDKQYTYSNVFKDSNLLHLSEEKFIDNLASSLNLISRKNSPDPKDFSDICYKKVMLLEHLPPSPEISSNYVFNMPVKDNVKITLDGQGADELLGGYSSFWKAFNYTHPFKGIFYHTPLKQKLILIIFSIAGLMKTEKLILRIKNYIKKYKIKKYSKLIGIDINDDILDKIFKEKSQLNTIQVRGMMDFTLLHTLPTLLWGSDTNSMQYSIESRLPYLDYRLVEFIASIPDCYKFRNGWTKYILRKSFEGKLPNEIVWRKDKRGFDDPDKIWLSNNTNNLKKWTDKKILEDSSIYKIKNKSLQDIFKNNFPLYMRLFLTKIWLETYRAHDS